MASRKPSPDPKLEALREQGTVNPRPQDVQEPLFQSGEFFDPRDLVQVKYEMLRRARSDGHSVAEAVARFGVSRPTFYKAQTDFDRDGLAGLLPAKRGPRGPHKLTEEVMALVKRALAKDPILNVATLADQIEKELGLRVHPRTIERALARSKKKRL